MTGWLGAGCHGPAADSCSNSPSAAPRCGRSFLWLTWRSLSGPFDCDAPHIHVCENPSVVIAAADQLGAEALPLVCTNGHPSAAVRRLLIALAERGATIHARADDDPSGRDIVATLRSAIPSPRLRRYPSTPVAVPRYEEQELPFLLQDLRGPSRSRSDPLARARRLETRLTRPSFGYNFFPWQPQAIFDETLSAVRAAPEAARYRTRSCRRCAIGLIAIGIAQVLVVVTAKIRRALQGPDQAGEVLGQRRVLIAPVGVAVRLIIHGHSNSLGCRADPRPGTARRRSAAPPITHSEP